MESLIDTVAQVFGAVGAVVLLGGVWLIVKLSRVKDKAIVITLSPEMKAEFTAIRGELHGLSKIISNEQRDRHELYRALMDHLNKHP